VLRDADGVLKASKSVTVKFDILQGSSSGIAVYSETHFTTTTSTGMIDLDLGTGTTLNGTLSSIDWGTGTYYLKITVDGTVMGTSQLLSVPYALYATNAGNSFSGSYDDLTNKPIVFDGTWNSLTGKPALASVAASGNYNDLTGIPVFANVATSGSYSDLADKPVFAAVASSGIYNDLSGKPVLATVATSGIYNDLTGKPVLATVATSGIYNDLTGKPVLATVATSGSYSDLTGTPVLAGVATSGSYNDLTNKPDLTVGTVKKLTVTSETTDMEEALFEVKNKSGQTVFAVYNEGVRIYVDNGSAKGAKGGFAIGGFDTKAGNQDYFVVNPDSIRMYVAEVPAKGAKGGFAIGGFGNAKALPQNLLVVNSDSIRAYIDTNTGKGSKGGFAIGGFDNAKGPGDEYLRVTRDSTRVYINNTPAKAPKGGFAIGGFGSAKGIENDYLLINPDSTNFYVRSEGGSTISTFNILSVNENLIQNPLMSADADTIAMTSVLNVQNNISVVGDIGYTGAVTPADVPVISSSQVINVTQTSGLAGGTISSNGGAAIITSGVCWSSSEFPTIDLGTKTTNGSTTGTFTSLITGLTAGTTYFVRAYATNSIGTGYGEEVIFTTNVVSPVLASLTTATPGSITHNSAVSGGDIFDNGGAQITVGGVCWSTSPGPLVTDSHTSEPYPQGIFASSITGLTVSTTYYVRAYATSVAGTAYGNEVSFTTSPAPVTDIDGNIYNIVNIGSQTWFTSNLKTTRLDDGTAIANVTDEATWSLLSTPAYAWYNNDIVGYGEYGILYNWETVNTGQLCPAGWQVPTEGDMFTLETTLGGSTVAGGKLKEAGLLHWLSPNTGATNEFGFTALPGGFRNYMGMFMNLGTESNWWTSSMLSVDPTFYTMNTNTAEIIHPMMFAKSGMYIRCMKNN